MKQGVFIRIAVALWAGFFVIACQSPRPLSYQEPLGQQKMKSAAHWKILAEDVASQISIGMKKANCESCFVYVDKPTESQFGNVFYNMLLTSLVNQGINTLESPKNDALAVSFVTQVVFHNKKTRKIMRPEEMTLLTAGIFVTRQIFRWASVTDQILGLGALATSISLIDEIGAGSLSEGIPQTEVIISVSILKQGQFLIRKTDCYYVDDSDFGLYHASTEAKTIRLSR